MLNPIEYNQLPFKNIGKYGYKYQKLGQGSFGSVYLYKNTTNKYAVKIMNNDDGITGSTIKEVSILTRLHHPNIVKIYDVILSELNVKMLMELASGDFRTYLNNTVLKSSVIKLFMYQLVKGLEYMHSKTVWHRDIKPANILIFPGKILKFTDFGLSRFGALPNNMYTVPIGTPLYRPPEIVLGAERYGPEVDIWGLGIILSQMAEGNYVNIKGKFDMNKLLLPQLLPYIVKQIGGMTKEQWPGISGMQNFKYISKVNEDYGQVFLECKISNTYPK